MDTNDNIAEDFYDATINLFSKSSINDLLIPLTCLLCSYDFYYVQNTNDDEVSIEFLKVSGSGCCPICIHLCTFCQKKKIDYMGNNLKSCEQCFRLHDEQFVGDQSDSDYGDNPTLFTLKGTS